MRTLRPSIVKGKNRLWILPFWLFPLHLLREPPDVFAVYIPLRGQLQPLSSSAAPCTEGDPIWGPRRQAGPDPKMAHSKPGLWVGKWKGPRSTSPSWPEFLQCSRPSFLSTLALSSSVPNSAPPGSTGYLETEDSSVLLRLRLPLDLQKTVNPSPSKQAPDCTNTSLQLWLFPGFYHHHQC